MDKSERTLKEDLEDLKFSCMHKSNGCVQDGIKYESFIKHCYEICLFAQVPCEFCKKEMLRSELLNNHISSCELRKIKCISCDQLFNFNFHPTHEKDCIQINLKKIKLELESFQKGKKPKVELHFSKNVLYTNYDVTVSNDKKQIGLKKMMPGGLSAIALLKPKLGLKYTKSIFRIRIVENKCWIGIGIGDPLVLSQLALTISDSQIENQKHGGYMISCNGIKWSCNVAGDNYTQGFPVEQNDIVQVTYTRTENIKRIHFINENTKKETSLRVQEVEPNWINRLRAFIILGDCNDVVEILSSSFSKE